MENTTAQTPYEAHCARMKNSPHSPENSLAAFKAFWDRRMMEVGTEQANAEYAACNSPWKGYIAGCQDHAKLIAAFNPDTYRNILNARRA